MFFVPQKVCETCVEQRLARTPRITLDFARGEVRYGSKPAAPPKDPSYQFDRKGRIVSNQERKP